MFKRPHSICHLVCRVRSQIHPDKTSESQLISTQLYKSGHQCVVLHPQRIVRKLSLSLLVISSFPGARTTGPAYQSQTQAEERGTALHMCNLSRVARPRRRVRHPSTVECILSGPGATLNAMSGSTQWVCGSTLFMLACRVILQVHNPQATTRGPPSSGPGRLL